MLYLGSGNTNFKRPYNGLIIYFPFEESGQWLRLGKVKPLDSDKSRNLVPEYICLEHKLIHIQFGIGVVLPKNQIHAGTMERRVTCVFMQSFLKAIGNLEIECYLVR